MGISSRGLGTRRNQGWGALAQPTGRPAPDQGASEAGAPGFVVIEFENSQGIRVVIKGKAQGLPYTKAGLQHEA